MENFWREIKKGFGPVPKRIKVILEQVEFIHKGLGLLDEGSIREIEQDVRNFPVTTGRTAQEWKTELDYFGDLHQFQFTAGERSALKVIAGMVKEHWDTKYCKNLLRNESAAASSSAPHTHTREELDETAKTVKMKIVDYFKTK